MAKLLIISTQAPYVTSAAQDALEAALAASNVGVEVTFVFAQQGLYQLLSGQISTCVQRKSIEKQINVLPLYDIDAVYYIAEDMVDLKLSSQALTSTAESIDTKNFIELCAAANAILRF
jgi:tRNA 2-thiouridine synthesizing protein C